MASRDYVLMALSDRHLRAIGKVAAQWSSLEFAILRAIAEVARVDYETTLIMVAAQGFPAWCELLKALSGDVTPKPKPKINIPTVLEKLTTEMSGLHGERNMIVHCAWSAPYGVTPGMGLVGTFSLPTPKGHEKAKGSGIKKRQNDPVIPIAYSAPEMLAVARRIDKAETALRKWLDRWRQTHPPKHGRRLNEGLLAQAYN